MAVTVMTAEQTTLDVLLSEEQVQCRIRELGEQIGRDYPIGEIILVGILKGSYLFLADLSRQIPGDIRIEFIQVSSYDGQKSSQGIVQIKKDLDTNIEGKHVLLVEDIVDTGLTLKHLRELLGTRRPRSLKAVCLLSKPEARTHATTVEYVGFEIPNDFVVGYGLDYGERYRNLPFIAILHNSSE